MALRVQPRPDVAGSRLADPRVWVAVLGIATVGLGGLIARDVYFPAAASTRWHCTRYDVPRWRAPKLPFASPCRRNGRWGVPSGASTSR